MMSRQAIRRGAPRAAPGAQAKMRVQRAEREKRLEGLAVQGLIAVRERDAAIAAAERRAGGALAAMTGKGLSMPELVSWCGEEGPTREISRMRRAARRTADAEAGNRDDDNQRDDPGSVDGPLDSRGDEP